MEGEELRNMIKVQRAIRDLTQADLAVMAGVTRRSVNAIETGRMVPSVLLALKIARALDVSVETIFGLLVVTPVTNNLHTGDATTPGGRDDGAAPPQPASR